MLFFEVVVWRVHVQLMIFGEGGGEIIVVREIGLVMIVKSWLRYAWSLNGRRRRSLWSQSVLCITDRDDHWDNKMRGSAQV